MICQVPMDEQEEQSRAAGDDWVDQEGNPCPGSKYQAERERARPPVKKGTVDYAKYEARRKNIIAMLRAACIQEVLHIVTVGGEGVDPYEAAKRIHGWTVSEVELAMDEGFLVPLSSEEEPPTEQEIRELYIEAANEVVSYVE